MLCYKKLYFIFMYFKDQDGLIKLEEFSLVLTLFNFRACGVPAEVQREIEGADSAFWPKLQWELEF